MSTVYNDPIMLDSTGQDIVTKLDSIASLMGDGVIDDTSTATDTTWSSNKITSELVGKQDELTFDHTPKDDSLNPVYSDGIYDSIIGVYDNLELGLGWDSKNILGIANTSKEVNGITFTVNDDGTVKLNGTATSATLYALNKFTGAELKKYGVNLLMTGGKDNSTFLTLMTQDWSYTKDDKGDGVEINISELIDATEYTVIIQIANGTTLSNYVMSPMIRLVNVIDPSFKKHHDSVDVIKADKVNVIANTKLIKDTVGWSGKNLIPTKTSNTSGVVKFVVNSDGTITINGTAPSFVSFTLLTVSELQSLVNKYGALIFNGNNASGGSSSVRIFCRTSAGYIFNDDAGEATIPANATITENLQIQVVGGYTASDYLIKPMLRDADILDSTYEPYFGSTAFPRSEQAVLGAYNIVQNNMVNHSKNDVTFTVTSDKIITLSGTSSGDITVGNDNGTIGSVKDLPLGKYKLVGCPSGGSGSTYRLTIQNTAGTAWITDTGNGIEFTLTEGHTWDKLYIRANSGVNLTGKIFKPMITTDLNATYDDYVAPAMTNKELTDKMKINGSQITLGSNVTANHNKVNKQGNVVDLYLFIVSMPDTASGDVIIGITPFKPIDDYLFFTVYSTDSPYQPIAGGFIRGSNGDIVIKSGAMNNKTSCYIQCTYICQ